MGLFDGLFKKKQTYADRVSSLSPEERLKEEQRQQKLREIYLEAEKRERTRNIVANRLAAIFKVGYSNHDPYNPYCCDIVRMHYGVGYIYVNSCFHGEVRCEYSLDGDVYCQLAVSAYLSDEELIEKINSFAQEVHKAYLLRSKSS